jgi:sulfur transfer protein SufE
VEKEQKKWIEKQAKLLGFSEAEIVRGILRIVINKK